MYKVIFKHPEQARIYKKLLDAVIQVCNDYKKDVVCSAGYRDRECQIATNTEVLARCKTNYQLADGSVYNKERQCLASAYGKSNHCFCIALDLTGWFELLTNAQLKKYGLIKPLSYEPWHVQLIELTGIGKEEKEAIRDSVLNGGNKDMDVKGFQTMTGLEPDGISGTKTKEKAKEILACCQEILGINFTTPEEAIKACTSNPDTWLDKLTNEKYFKVFVSNILNKMGGKG